MIDVLFLGFQTKGVARWWAPPIEMLFYIFKLNFSWDMSKMHYFSGKFSKIVKRWGGSPQRHSTFNIDDLKFCDLAK